MNYTIFNDSRPFYKVEQRLHRKVRDPFHIAVADVLHFYPLSTKKLRLSKYKMKERNKISSNLQTQACEKSANKLLCKRLQNSSIVGFSA
jgi:hypothetical protein